MVAETQFQWNWSTVRHVPTIVFASGLVDDFGLRPRHGGQEFGTEVIIGFDHANYSHMAVMPEVVRAALAEDFD